jgi:hypothetical protein
MVDIGSMIGDLKEGFEYTGFFFRTELTNPDNSLGFSTPAIFLFTA